MYQGCEKLKITIFVLLGTIQNLESNCCGMKDSMQLSKMELEPGALSAFGNCGLCLDYFILSRICHKMQASLNLEQPPIKLCQLHVSKIRQSFWFKAAIASLRELKCHKFYFNLETVTVTLIDNRL